MLQTLPTLLLSVALLPLGQPPLEVHSRAERHASSNRERLDDLVTQYHDLRAEHDEVFREHQEIPTDLADRLDRCVGRIARHGSDAAESFLLSRLPDRGPVQTIVLQGLLINDREELVRRIYKKLTQLEEGAFLHFCEYVRLASMKHVEFDQLARWVNSNPTYRRRGVMVYLARVGTADAVRYLLECPLVDPKDEFFNPGSARETQHALRAALARIKDATAKQTILVAFTGKPSRYGRGPRAFPWATQASACLALGDLRYTQAAAAILPKLGSKYEELAVAAARALGELREPRAAKPIQRALKKRRGVEFKLAAMIALTRLNPTMALLDLMKQSESRDWRIRSVATRCLGTIDIPDCRRRLRVLLGDDGWQIRKAAFEALIKRPDRALIDALIATLHKHTGALLPKVYGTLIDLTGKDLGPSPDLWREYWKRERERFALGERAGRTGSTAKIAGNPDRPVYFGLEVMSHEMAFVIDTSGSMRWAYTMAGPKGTRKVQGLEIVQRELWHTLTKLTEDQKFNVVSFNGGFHPLFKRPRNATTKNRGFARQYIQRLIPVGATNIYDPLESLLIGGEVDTVYLLSDGAPSAGKYRDPRLIVDQIRRINEYSQVTIHGIALGHRSTLLEALAKETGGRYLRVDQ